jgi:hypothetical protein
MPRCGQTRRRRTCPTDLEWKFGGTKLDPQAPERLLALALAGLVGF